MQEENIVKRIWTQTKACCPYIWTTSWGLLLHLLWLFLTLESCLGPGQVSLLCSPLLAPTVPIYLRFFQLQTCHIYRHKWCTEGPCSLQTGSECLSPSLLVVLLFIGTPPWKQNAWMTERLGLLEMELQGFRIQLSTEGGGRFFIFFWWTWVDIMLNHCDMY